MAYEVARVSAPANFLSVRRIPPSAPLNSPSLMMSAARDGPIVRSITSVPFILSLIVLVGLPVVNGNARSVRGS